jgi:N-acetylmuramoyl-L-alanine amidase
VEPVSPSLSILGKPPEWSRLEAWQETMTREDFVALLTGVFVVGERWREFIEIGEDRALIQTGEADEVFTLRFAEPGMEKSAPRRWKTPEDLPETEEGTPLQGLHIAIDPGHIGGVWARVEERWLQVGGHPPVQEGDMTLKVARMIKPRLEKLGAKVSLVRDSLEPVTPLRPDSLEELAAEQVDPDSPQALRKLAERLFYRTAEIRARAELVNEKIKPDLVLCLHFNADAWGDAANPQLVDRTHFHLLLNGGYTEEEVGLADQRFILLEKMLSRTHEEEVRVGSTVAGVFVRETELPPYLYPPDALNAREIPGEPYLWARNLLANRLYECPVIFYEPYVMNSTIDHPRLVAGDYEGLREFNGKWQSSIFREYADAVVEGLREHYAARR